MKRTRRKFIAAFKAKVAIETLKEQMSIQELASKFEVLLNKIFNWKSEFFKNASMVFKKSKSESSQEDADMDNLYRVIGQQKIEIDFFKDSLGEIKTIERRQLVVKYHSGLSLKKECEIIGLSRSKSYYKPRGESVLNDQIMKCIDCHFIK
jgi:transposase-like protein